MFQLKHVHLIQFFLFQAETLDLDLTTAIIAPNGAGKSALLDALQIVMLGGDRNHIRFNAQAGGVHRARTIRDYCLGVYRAGEDGRARDTATTYISLVFEDEASGEVLTAGIGLGASTAEIDHRVHGLYLLPGVKLSLDDHLELVTGAELPLEWSNFRELIAQRCKSAGSKAELHTSGDRFVKDLLFRLRPGPTSHLDAVAYRKAFQNALNLQRVTDVDFFVRTLVAEERPTEIAKFRALLDGFRQIKEKIEQVRRRIEEAELVEQQYRKVASQAIRAASYRALGAEYQRDAHGDRIDAAETASTFAKNAQRKKQLALEQTRSDRQTARLESEEAIKRHQGTRGYNEQASFDQLASRDREEMVRLKKLLMRDAGYVRDQLETAGKLGLPTIDAEALARAIKPWQSLYQQLANLATDAQIAIATDSLHAELRQALEQALPIINAVAGYHREQENALEESRRHASTLRQNQTRIGAGQGELRPEVVRLLNILEGEGIPARPVCDLVRITDPTWQRAIEGYLRPHMEALLIPAEHEERAVHLYRSLQGIYGVKLALTSQARQTRGDISTAGHVSALLSVDSNDNKDALGYLRRQLGDLRCVETDAEVVRARQGLSRDGLVAKGGGIDRLRLPSTGELKIGVSGSRERLKLLHDEIAIADRNVSELESQWRPVNACAIGLGRIGTPDEMAQSAHSQLLKHREAESRYRLVKTNQSTFTDPDLIELSEIARESEQRSKDLDVLFEQLIADEAVAKSACATAEQILIELHSKSEAIARRAIEGFADPYVDPNRVEQQRNELDTRFPDLDDRVTHCQKRAETCESTLNGLLPDAWRCLAQYAKDNGLALEIEPQAWRSANALLLKEIGYLKGTELVQHQAAADEAYSIAVTTFRSNVASALYDNFTRLKNQINTLNRTLKNSPPFSNNERYQFKYEIAPELKELHRFINKAADVGETDTLFGSAGEVPAAFRDIIEDRATGHGGAISSPLDDYRRFFNFEVVIKQEDAVIGTLSERMRSGSGVIMLDEFGDKIDSQNARATTKYLRSLGLQLILAAPDTTQGTLTGVLDSYVELFRDGPLLQMERIVVSEMGRELLESDQFQLHPELLEQEIARIKLEQVST
jgi:chromosome segregation protein